VVCGLRLHGGRGGLSQNDGTGHIHLGLSNGRLERLSSKIRLLSHRSFGFNAPDPPHRPQLPLLQDAGIAERKNATPAQIRSRSRGCSRGSRGSCRSRAPENIAAAAVELTSDDLREIDSAASQITLHGARYPEHLEQLTGR
jgi:hypothetical protein